MSEFKKPLIKLEEGEKYTAKESDFVITEDHTFSDIIRFMISQGCDKNEICFLAENEINDKEKLLREIFGDNEYSEEDKYDKVMREGRGIFEHQESADNPYSFHKAFEFCLRELNKRDLLNTEQLTKTK